MGGIGLAFMVEDVFLTQFLFHFIRNNEVLLVGGAIHIRLEACVQEALLNLHGHGDGVAGPFHVQVVLEQLCKLNAQKSALGKETAVLFDDVAEILLDGRVHNDDSLAHESALLCAADIENIADITEEGQVEVGAFGSHAVAQSGAVNVENETVLVADLTDCLQLGLVVNGAHFCGVGKIDHGWLDNVLAAFVIQMVLAEICDLRCGNFPVFRFNGQNLVAVGLNGTNFVAADVADCRGNDPFVGAQAGGNDSHVGLGAADENVDIHIVSSTGLFNQFLCFCRNFIFAVTNVLVHIGFDQTLQNGRLAAFVIVAIEINHQSSSMKAIDPVQCRVSKKIPAA